MWGVAVAFASMVVASGCERQRGAVAEVHCFRYAGGPEAGIDPLVLGTYACFDDATVCQRRAKAGSETVCVASGAPSWHCFSLHSKGPLGDATFCYPNESICEASRKRMADPAIFKADESCTGDDVVFCYGTPTLSCFSDESMCNLSRQIISAAVKGAPPPGICTARYSSNQG